MSSILSKTNLSIEHLANNLASSSFNWKNWPDCQTWLKQLIAFDTTSCYSNLELIRFIENELKKAGLAPVLTQNNSGEKANLWVSIPDLNGKIKGGIVLSGHTDTVPIDGQEWATHPFTATLLDGKVYGRGTCDMKGFTAVCLALLPKMVNAPLSIPFHIALSYDEEVGCLGIPHLLADIAKRGIQPQACIVGEPTSMRPVIAHKSIHVYECQVHGRAAHSSLTPMGVNAIEYAARIICKIREIADQKRQTLVLDDAFDVPFTTAQTGLVQGGNAINTVPEHCRFGFEFRTIDNQEGKILFEQIEQYANQLIKEMHAVDKDTGIQFELLESICALEAAEDAAITQLVKTLTAHNQLKKVAYATEAGIFQSAGIPTIVCGPGNIEQAHRANEFVSVDQLIECEKFISRMIDKAIVGNPLMSY